MTEKMKTLCVGRFLVDVPAQAQVSLSREMLDGFDIRTVEESETAFHERVAAREAEIASHGAAGEGGGESGMVEARDLRVPGMVGRALIHDYSRGYLMQGNRRVDMESVSVEVHAHKGGFSFTLSATSTQESSAREAEALLARLQLRGEDDIPGVPGFCIGRAIFVEPLPPHKNEHIVMHVGLPDHPDVGMAFASLPGGGSDAGLLARTADIDAQAGADEMLRVTKLRAGGRTINALEGEEVLERVREMNFATTFGFMWEVRGTDNDPLRPFLSFELQAGIGARPGAQPADSSLHEDAVLGLWETVSSSIRLRPNGPPAASAPPPEPEGPKLGAVASAGEVCPQSGWWQCREGGPGIDVHGGQVQYLRKGERMPQALLLPRQTLWQKVRGIQPSMESPRLTSWTLVDKRLRPRTPAAVALAQPGAAQPGVAQPGVGQPGVGQPGQKPGLSAGLLATVPVGVYVRTGEACPASGWWRCEEPHALDGTRWFARGSLLPPATFQVPAGLFGKAAGPEVIQRRSIWQLVRHVEAADVALAAPGADEGPAAGVQGSVLPGPHANRGSA